MGHHPTRRRPRHPAERAATAGSRQARDGETVRRAPKERRPRSIKVRPRADDQERKGMPLVLLSLWLASAGQFETTIRCEYVARQFCGPGSGGVCSKVDVEGMYLLVPTRAVLERGNPWQLDVMHHE